METLEDLKAIIAGKPDGATHCNNVGEYGCYSSGDYFSRWTPEGMCATVNCNWRSLSDIERIIELMEATQGMLEVLAGPPDGYWRNEIKAAREAIGYE